MSPRWRVLAGALVSVVIAGGCTAPPVAPGATPSSAASATTTQPGPESRTALPAEETTVVAGDNAESLAIATSQALFRRTPAIVLAGASANDGGDTSDLGDASAVAVSLGVPLLLAPPTGAPTAAAALRGEIARLAPNTIVAVGAAATDWAQGAVDGAQGTTTPRASASATTVVRYDGDNTALPPVVPAAPLDALLVLALDQPSSSAAIATARASGARVLTLAHPDPRTDNDTIAALAKQPVTRVLALGDAFAPADRLRRRVDTAATGSLLPGGGQVVFPGRRMVALYGHPGSSVLGSLGEQSLSAAITRARKVAASYTSLVDEPVVPTFEIIATVAASSAGPDGNYSNEASIAHLRPWVDAAREAGVYIVLDLQPGLTDFLTQAKRYEVLLEQPHVGLALDPEWRLKPGQRHMAQIGSVSAAEINETAAWLAELTRTHNLPQKVLMLHQFRLDMITNRPGVATDHDELAVVIHADGFGTAVQKFSTWRAMHVNPPTNIWWGWKNFYDEDKPTFTPHQTVSIRPSPVFVSYQ